MLTAIVIAKNEQSMIKDCLWSLNFADELIVVDNASTDTTAEIARKFGAKVIKSQGADYSQVRNDGIKAAKGSWILFVDADERVSPELQQEISQIITSSNSASAYDLPRRNFYLGREMHYGGWGGDSVIRLFRKSALQKYEHPLHEQPVYTGELAKAHFSLIHYSHRDLTSMLEKTLHFTGYEAELRFNAHHPPVVWWRFLRVMFTEFYLRFVKLSAWKDGPRGIIDGLFQVFNSFIIYARLWEMQQS